MTFYHLSFFGQGGVANLIQLNPHIHGFSIHGFIYLWSENIKNIKRKTPEVHFLQCNYDN